MINEGWFYGIPKRTTFRMAKKRIYNNQLYGNKDYWDFANILFRYFKWSKESWYRHAGKDKREDRVLCGRVAGTGRIRAGAWIRKVIQVAESNGT